MRTIAGISAAAICALLLSTGARADQPPVRQLVYDYTFSGSSMGVERANAFENVTGISTDAATSGSNGKIHANVMMLAADGGIVVDVFEEINRVLRPTATVRCAAYGDRVFQVCDQGKEISSEEAALLSFIGRSFYDPARLDKNGHWRVGRDDGGVKIDYDFGVVKQAGDLVTISVHRTSTYRGASGGDSTTDGTIVYDPAMTIPTSIHLETRRISGEAVGSSIINLTLASDSFAKPAQK